MYALYLWVANTMLIYMARPVQPLMSRISSNPDSAPSPTLVLSLPPVAPYALTNP